MIRVKFLSDGDLLTGFDISGHGDYADAGEDIVCSAVSSAAYMAANTVTDILNQNADISLDESGSFYFSTQPTENAQIILKGLRLHLEALSQEYPENIKVTT